jgi:hypothetical protein
MKTLRQLCVATILSLTLSVSVLAGHMDTTGAPAPALAGHIDTTGAPPPAPPPTNLTTQSTSTVTAIALMVVSLIYR